MNETPITRWQDIDPAGAADIDLTDRTDITAPLNELGDRCPWPWDPQQLGTTPLGQYHCPYCGALVIAGEEHTDYAYTPPGRHADSSKNRRALSARADES